MIFDSAVFLFYFLPLVLLGYFLSPKRGKNLVLLIASLLFYAWGEGLFVLGMCGVILASYVAGLAIESTQGRGIARLILGVTIAANLLFLSLYKYSGFIVDSLEQLLGVNWSIDLSTLSLPIGISFFTFQAISYVFDVYRKETPAQRNPLDLALYISLFPQLIAGPIVRYSNIARDLEQRRHSLELFNSGVARFIVGLSKKVILADSLGRTADLCFEAAPHGLSTGVAWLGLICFAFQIYFDFSGYSDMAIGLGRMFGFHFHENFNYPYVARSLRDFWQRWHISLSTWFRDYLYIPLGGNQVGRMRLCRNLFLVFFLCGLWHGANWTFVIWGLAHGLLLSLERLGLQRILLRLPLALQHLYLLLAVALTWVLFRSPSLEIALGYYRSLFVGSPSDLSIHTLLDRETQLLLLMAAIASTPLAPFFRRLAEKAELRYGAYALLRFGSYASLFLCSLVYVAASTHRPFIYFRF